MHRALGGHTTGGRKRGDWATAAQVIRQMLSEPAYKRKMAEMIAKQVRSQHLQPRPACMDLLGLSMRLHLSVLCAGQ